MNVFDNAGAGKSAVSIKELALFGMLGALLFGAKMALAALPNIEPVSLLVMLFAVCYGWRGMYPVCMYILLEFAVWGLGLWAISYLYVWVLLFLAARLLRKMRSPLLWAALSGVFGLSFGALCALAYIFVGGWEMAVSWWISGLQMDALHGISNFFIALTLFSPLRKAILRIDRESGMNMAKE